MLRLATALLLVCLDLRDSAACDPARDPFEVPAVGIAVADVAIVGEVLRIAGTVATVKIADAWKGAAKAGDTVEIRGIVERTPLDRFCGTHPIEVGKRFVFLLWAPLGAITELQPISPAGGIEDFSPAAERTFKAALAKQHPHSAWRTNPNGIATQLVLEAQPARPGDLDLLLVLRNTTAKPIALKHRSWPLATMSKCALDVVEVATQRRVPPKDVPIAKQEIARYFARNPRAYELPIPPGASHAYHLFRVTTAAPGWGHKEELGFAFYPIATPGEHAFSAVCANLFGPGTQVATAAVRLTP